MRAKELERLVERLSRELAAAMERIHQLEAENAALKAKLGENSGNSSKPPSSDPPWSERKPKEPSGRKPGGQPGHTKHERTFLEPDRVVSLRPKICGCCGAAVHANEEPPERHQVIEMPKVEPDVTDYHVYSGDCDRCGAVTRAQLPPGVPKRGYGPRLTAVVSLCSGKYRLSKRLIQSIMADLLGVDLSLGSVANLEQEMSASLAAPARGGRRPRQEAGRGQRRRDRLVRGPLERSRRASLALGGDNGLRHAVPRSA